MNRNTFKVKTMCQTLNVSRSGYYSWLKQRGEPDKSNSLRKEIKRVFIFTEIVTVTIIGL